MRLLKSLATGFVTAGILFSSGVSMASDSKSGQGVRTSGGDEIGLQLFHWNSVKIHQNEWYDRANNPNNIKLYKDLGVTMVWSPPPWRDRSSWEGWSDAHKKYMRGGKEGYFWSDFNLNSNYGTAAELKTLAERLDAEDIKIIYDIVLNHRDNGRMDYCTQDSYNCWTGGNNRWARNSGDDGDQFLRKANGEPDYGPEVNVGRATNTFVHYMNILVRDYKAAGWRYDYIRGFAPSHADNITKATTDNGFCVGELWTDTVSQDDLNYYALESKCTMFDFPTYRAFINKDLGDVRYGMAANRSASWREKAVTMIGSHDKSWSPEHHQDHDFSQDLWPVSGDIYPAALVYILTAPGTPMLYFPDMIRDIDGYDGNGWAKPLNDFKKGWSYNLAQSIISIRKRADVRAYSAINFHSTAGNGVAYSVEGNKGTVIASLWIGHNKPSDVSSYFNNNNYELAAEGSWGKVWIEKTQDNNDNTDSGTKSTYPSMKLRGSFTSPSWGNGANMLLVDDYTWEVEVDLSAGDEFKFDEKNVWGNRFGANGVLDCTSYPCTGTAIGPGGGGSNISVDTTGSYTISLNDKTKVFSINLNQAEVNEAPNARAKIDETNVLKNADITFEDNGSSDPNGDNLSYTWFVDGVSTYSGKGPHTHSFSTAGDYEIKLTVTESSTSETYSSSDSISVTVANGIPVARAGKDAVLVKNTSLPIDASASDDPDGDTLTSFLWTCETQDGNSCSSAGWSDISSSTGNVSFSTNDYYKLTLTVSDGTDSSSDSMIVKVVDEIPLVSINPSMNLTGTFNNWGMTAMTLVADYTWQVAATFAASNGEYKFDVFGDGNTEIGAGSGGAICNTTISNPEDTGGAQAAGAAVDVDNTGNFVIELNDNTMTWKCVLTEEPLPITADAGSDVTADSGDSVCLSGSASNGTTPYEYTWSHGETGATPCHTFTNTSDQAEVHSITLTVKDNNGDVAYDIVEVTVNPEVNEAPTADFSAQPTSGDVVWDGGVVLIDAGGSVTFDGNPSSDSDGSISEYLWSGGGIANDNASFTHQFDDVGDYSITLQVTDNDGATAAASIIVRVGDGLDETDVEVTFTCTNGKTTRGTSVYVVGDRYISGANQDEDHLGDWGVRSDAQKLNPTSYPTWSGTIKVPANSNMEWKCVKADERTLNITQWQSGSNNEINDTGSGGGTYTGGF